MSALPGPHMFLVPAALESYDQPEHFVTQFWKSHAFIFFLMSSLLALVSSGRPSLAFYFRVPPCVSQLPIPSPSHERLTASRISVSCPLPHFLGNETRGLDATLEANHEAPGKKPMLNEVQHFLQLPVGAVSPLQSSVCRQGL